VRLFRAHCRQETTEYGKHRRTAEITASQSRQEYGHPDGQISGSNTRQVSLNKTPACPTLPHETVSAAVRGSRSPPSPVVLALINRTLYRAGTLPRSLKLVATVLYSLPAPVRDGSAQIAIPPICCCHIDIRTYPNLAACSGRTNRGQFGFCRCLLRTERPRWRSALYESQPVKLGYQRRMAGRKYSARPTNC
jgi:hypothetical protein